MEYCTLLRRVDNYILLPVKHQAPWLGSATGLPDFSDREMSDRPGRISHDEPPCIRYIEVASLSKQGLSGCSILSWSCLRFLDGGTSRFIEDLYQCVLHIGNIKTVFVTATAGRLQSRANHCPHIRSVLSKMTTCP